MPKSGDVMRSAGGGPGTLASLHLAATHNAHAHSGHGFPPLLCVWASSRTRCMTG